MTDAITSADGSTLVSEANENQQLSSASPINTGRTGGFAVAGSGCLTTPAQLNAFAAECSSAGERSNPTTTCNNGFSIELVAPGEQGAFCARSRARRLDS